MNRAMRVGLAACLALAACGTMRGSKGQTFPLQLGEGITAAKGEVHAKDDGKGNVDVELKVDHLAPAGMVRPDATTYVVWLRPKETGQPQNVGVMKVGDKREGRFKTKTPFRDFDIFVTAETNAQVGEPGGDQVLRAAVSPTQRATF